MAKITLTNRQTKNLRALVDDNQNDPEIPVVGTTGTFSGDVAAGSFTGPLTGNSAGTHTGPTAATSVSNSGTLIESGAITSPALSAGETVLYTPASASRLVVLAASGVWFLDSMAAGSVGERRTVINGSAYAGALGHAEGASYGGAADLNCFNCPDAIPFVLRPGARAEMIYGPYNAGAVNRWNVLGVNAFAPGGRLCPATIVEFLERTAFTPTFLWPCDDDGLGSAQPLRSALDAIAGQLEVVGAPLLDYRLGGYRGVRVADNVIGWRADVASPASNSVLRGVFFGSTVSVVDNWLAGRYGPTNGARTAGVLQANGKFAHLCYDGTNLANAEVNKIVDDGVVRLGHVQLDKTANISRARVSGRGEAAVASADVGASLIGSLAGTGAAFTFVGGTGLNGSDVAFIGGCYLIVGATAAGALNQAKIAHRLGME